MRYKILTVDDAKTVRLIVRKAFRTFDCEIIEAANGVEGLAMAAKTKPDLVLLDITMPVMDGIEMLTQIKVDPQLRSIPVIMLTAEGGRDHVMKIAELGVRDYIVKPFKEDTLMRSGPGDRSAAHGTGRGPPTIHPGSRRHPRGRRQTDHRPADCRRPEAHALENSRGGDPRRRAGLLLPPRAAADPDQPVTAGRLGLCAVPRLPHQPEDQVHSDFRFGGQDRYLRPKPRAGGGHHHGHNQTHRLGRARGPDDQGDEPRYLFALLSNPRRSS